MATQRRLDEAELARKCHHGARALKEHGDVDQSMRANLLRQQNERVLEGTGGEDILALVF